MSNKDSLISSPSAFALIKKKRQKSASLVFCECGHICLLFLCAAVLLDVSCIKELAVSSSVEKTF